MTNLVDTQSTTGEFSQFMLGLVADRTWQGFVRQGLLPDGMENDSPAQTVLRLYTLAAKLWCCGCPYCNQAEPR